MTTQDKIQHALATLQRQGTLVLDDKEYGRLSFVKSEEYPDFWEFQELYYYFDSYGEPFVGDEVAYEAALNYQQVTLEVTRFFTTLEQLECL